MMKCSKKAFAMCQTRHLCGALDDATFTEESECAAFNNAVEDKPMTNADRIRAMSDEELCEYMMSAPAIPCDVKISAMMKRNNCYDCQACIMEWLKQPAEGE